MSFPAAVTVTWLLNRRYTFRTHRPARAAQARYFAGQAAGALINFGVFIAALQAWPLLQAYPVVPLALGAGIALVFNFCWSQWVVFKRPGLPG